MALVDVSMAQAYLREWGSDLDDDLSSWLGLAEAVLHRWLRFPLPDNGVRALDSTAYTLYLDGPAWDASTDLHLGLYPVIGVPTIQDDPDWVYTGKEVAKWFLVT